jgi:hypothetical protein
MLQVDGELPTEWGGDAMMQGLRKAKGLLAIGGSLVALAWAGMTLNSELHAHTKAVPQIDIAAELQQLRTHDHTAQTGETGVSKSDGWTVVNTPTWTPSVQGWHLDFSDISLPANFVPATTHKREWVESTVTGYVTGDLKVTENGTLIAEWMSVGAHQGLRWLEIPPQAAQAMTLERGDRLTVTGVVGAYKGNDAPVLYARHITRQDRP